MKLKLSLHHSYSDDSKQSPGSKSFFQPKLTINQPNDVYEKEADAMADKVMRMPEKYEQKQTFFKPTVSALQRKCAACEEEEKVAQRKENGSVTSSADVEKYIGSASGKGKNLSQAERSFFEPKFGYNFSNVQIHSGTEANASAKSINAFAYTYGNNIVFANNQYQPDNEAGKKLLAHELTHVVQQSQNIAPPVQRQPDNAGNDEATASKNDVVQRLENDTFFNKLEKKIKDEIKDAIKTAPEKITQAVLEKIIDATVTDPQYKEGLKKATEAIIKTITGKKPVSTSKCDAVPGYHEGGSKEFKGQCCTGSYDSAQTCCPKDKFAPNNSFSNCCSADEVVNAEGKCEKPQAVDPTTICIAPGKKDSMGKCCMPPFDVIDGICTIPPKEEPKAQPFSLKFTIGVIDDYNIDEFTINSRQKTHFEEVKKQIHQFMEACPASMVTITGFTDKPGTEEHNMDLGQRRADYVKLLLQLDLIKINAGGLPPLIFSRSEGENDPADLTAGEKFSAINRRVEIEFNSMCPPLGNGSTVTSFDTPFRLTLR